MKTSMNINGRMQLVLVPETDVEKLFLQELFKQETESQSLSTVQVIDKQYTDCFVLSPKKTT